MEKTIFTIILFVIDILLIIFLLYKVPIQKGVYIIFGWEDNKNDTEYTLTMYNLSKEKIETYNLKNKEEYEKSFKYQHVKIYRNGLFGKWFVTFIPFEDILCD